MIQNNCAYLVNDGNYLHNLTDEYSFVLNFNQELEDETASYSKDPKSKVEEVDLCNPDFQG